MKRLVVYILVNTPPLEGCVILTCLLFSMDCLEYFVIFLSFNDLHDIG